MTGPSPSAARIAELEAALKAREWQPIETAPKDGTEVLLIGGAYGGRPFVGFWDAHDWFPDRPWQNAISATRLYAHVPTHWQPLPSPPLSCTG